jgi:hypothetical protein
VPMALGERFTGVFSGIHDVLDAESRRVFPLAACVDSCNGR